MEYISLNNLTNKYPSGSRINPTASLSESYTTGIDDNGNRIIILTGASDENKVIINVESSSINLKDINVVDNTTFKFVIEYKFSDNSEFYTSKVYYDELVKAKEESNPYYSTYLLETEISRLVIQYEGIQKKIRDDIEKDIERGINFRKKHAFEIDASNNIKVDLEFYTKYIDWVTSSDNTLNFNSIDNIVDVEINEETIRVKQKNNFNKIATNATNVQNFISEKITEKLISLELAITKLQVQIQNLSNR
jgi:hypothetical protein